ncbi:hypothetical protein [Lysobacter gummosus]|uniref:Secreted protein n=1 Tax=Lysobacter gummosus TaxID=262324 RepID=A0ABY3XHL5_9GAMM|nr:hypothetical protein [Lysobacter gummosus]UNP31139.1 hypothetical protein MOV92_07795 [Lysobacter gummosus]
MLLQLQLQLQLQLLVLVLLQLLVLPPVFFCCCGASLVTRETEGHPKGGAHGRAPGPTLGRMPNVGPACVGIALVAFDSKQLKPFLWLLLTEGNPVGLCGFGQRK